MKCYFTFNNDVENNEVYLNMLEVALKSARQNTTLDLNALYEGNASDKLYRILRKYNVKVNLCSLSFYPELEKFYFAKNKEKYGSNIKQIACNFLKFEIPLFENEDEIVLYSDMDVIFMKDINYSENIKTLAAAGEFFENYDIIKGNKYFNAGVMFLNITELKKRREKLIKMLKNYESPYQECADQGFFNEIYKNNFVQLSPIYNWKPYWGINDNACIVHLHGFKPKKQNAEEWCTFVMSRFPRAFEGWIYYYIKFFKILDVDEDKYITDLAVMLSNCKVKTEKVNVFKKLTDKLNWKTKRLKNLIKNRLQELMREK